MASRQAWRQYWRRLRPSPNLFEAGLNLKPTATTRRAGERHPRSRLSGKHCNSGIADAKEFYELSAKGSSPAQLVVLAYEIQTLYPQFQANQILTERALALYPQVERACAMASTDSDTTAAHVMKPGWQGNGVVEQFFARNTIGQKPADRPLLLVSSHTDPAVRMGMTARLVARLCGQGDVVQFHDYQSSEFASVLGDSVRDQLTWIQGRFAGRHASSNCH